MGSEKSWRAQGVESGRFGTEKALRAVTSWCSRGTVCHVTQCLQLVGALGGEVATPLTFPSALPPPTQALGPPCGWFSRCPPFLAPSSCQPARIVLATRGRVCPQLLAHSKLLSGSTPLGFLAILKYFDHLLNYVTNSRVGLEERRARTENPQSQPASPGVVQSKLNEAGLQGQPRGKRSAEPFHLTPAPTLDCNLRTWKHRIGNRTLDSDPRTMTDSVIFILGLLRLAE